MVNINACKKATNNSIIEIKKANRKETEYDPTIPNFALNVIDRAMIPITTTWPAVILANKRTSKENGFVNNPNISIGAKSIFIGTGTPGIQKICPQ